MAGFLSGLAEGMQAAQQQRTGMLNNAIKVEQLKMRREELGMQREQFEFQKSELRRKEAARLKSEELQKGMQEAFKVGGTPAAVDFLKQHDIQSGLALEKNINETKTSMLEAAGMQAENKSKQNKYLKEAFSMVGNFGAVLEQVGDPAEQERLYKDNLPMLKTIMPTLPNTLNEKARNMIQGAYGLSIPEGKLFESKQAKTDVGKLATDKQNLLAKGHSIDSKEIKALDAEIASKAAEADAKKVEAVGGLLPKDKVGAEDKLRDEVNKLSKDFRAVQDSYNRIQASGRAANFAGDLSLIFNYMKMLDPGSVVRESEFATAQNAPGVPDRVRAMYNRVVDGERFNQKTRQTFLNMADELLESQRKSYDVTRGGYQTIVENRGLDPKNVFIEFEKASEGPEKVNPQQAEQLVGLPDEQLVQQFSNDKEMTSFIQAFIKANKGNPNVKADELTPANAIRFKLMKGMK